MTRLRAGYWLVFAATLAVYLAMVGWTLPGIAAAAGGLMPFDLRPAGYGPQEARAFLAALGDPGREIYLGPQRWLDAIYPALLAVVLGGAVLGLVRRRAPRAVLLLAIFGGMAADYVENMHVASLLTAEGAISDQAIARASRATQVKSALTGVAMAAVAVALAVRLTGKRRRR